MVALMMALQSCAGFAVVPAGRLVPALGARARPLRRLVVAAALSDDKKDVKPADAYAAASPGLRTQSDEAAMETVAEAGRQELKGLADLTKQEQEELKKKLEEEITLAMTGASIEMLEEYDQKTQAILEKMKEDRDIIREETANLERLAKSMEQPLWWKKGDNEPKPGEKGSSKFSVPLALAWMFGFAGANELYQMYLNDEGVQFIPAGKAVFDGLLAVVSGGIALRKKKAE